MKLIKKIAKVISIVLVLCILVVGIGDAIWIYAPQVMAEKKIEKIENYAKNINDIDIPNGTKVVALGEATHGNAEFQNMKLDVLKLLVEKNKVRAFALETDFGEGLMINDYIHNGVGNPKDIIKNLSFKIYHTENMENLIKWIKDYNSKVNDNEKISFYGFDMQQPEANVKYIVDYCKDNGIGNYKKIDDKLKILYNTKVKMTDKRVVEAEECLKELKEELNGLAKKAENNVPSQNKAIEKYPIDSEVILRAIECILNSIEYYRKDSTDYMSMNNMRDKCMSENVQWIQKYEEKRGNSTIMISGHNGHIGLNEKMYKSMGEHLYDIYKDKYFAIGTDYFKTECNINNIGISEGRGNYKFCSADPLAAQAKRFAGTYYLDFSDINKDSGELYKMVNSDMRMGSLGEGYSFLMKFLPISNRIKQTPTKKYRAMIFVYEATPIKIIN